MKETRRLPDWQQIDDIGTTFRLSVFGGWIIQDYDAEKAKNGAMCFVPDPKHEWEIK